MVPRCRASYLLSARFATLEPQKLWMSQKSSAPNQAASAALVQLVMTCLKTWMACCAQPPTRRALAGRGAYAIRALSDLCLGIVSGRLVSTRLLLESLKASARPGAF